MSIALMNVFDVDLVRNIHDLIQTEPEVEWETVYGSVEIYRTKHIITYGGGPEGGYVYFWCERSPGWYNWHRDHFQEPRYTKIQSGQVAVKWEDDVEKIGILPDNWEELGYGEDEDITIMDSYFMEELNGE